MIPFNQITLCDESICLVFVNNNIKIIIRCLAKKKTAIIESLVLANAYLKVFINARCSASN